MSEAVENVMKRLQPKNGPNYGRRSCLAREVVQILYWSSPNFSLNRISDMCLSSGLFNAKEASNLFKHALFPDWFLNELYNIFPRTAEISRLTSKSHEAVSLCKAGKLILSPPAAQAVSGNRTKAFTFISSPMPELLVSRGGNATHYASTWLNLSWSNDGVIGPRTDLSARFLLNFMQNAETLRLPGRTFLGVTRSSNNYSHWLLNTFPRLLALIEAGMDIDQFGQFVLFFAGHEFHKKMLKELGIGPERIIATSTQGRIFKTDEFAFASGTRLKRVASANIYDMLCSFFGQPSRTHLGERKLFISRSKANRRKIINEDEVVAYLERMGYERIWLEDVGIREAAAMMAEAKAVIAPHGAGLANLVFCLPGTKVLELFCSQFTSEYWKLSSQKNLIYYAFEADGPDGEKLDSLALEKLKFRERQQDMTVSMNEFKDFINNQFERE